MTTAFLTWSALPQLDMKLSTAFASLALAISQVQAHGGVISYTLGGAAYVGFSAYNTPVGQKTIQREWDSYNPITR